MCKKQYTTFCKNVSLGAFTGSVSGALEDFAYNASFDPSGTWTNMHNTVPIPDWTSLDNIFDAYKVNFIDLTFTVLQWPQLDVETYDGAAATNDNQMATLAIRDLYDPQATITAAYMRELRNVTLHRFDRGSGGSTFQYRIFPKNALLGVGDSGNTAPTYHWAPASFMDIDRPGRLEGCAFVLQLPDEMTVTASASYNITFTHDR